MHTEAIKSKVINSGCTSGKHGLKKGDSYSILRLSQAVGRGDSGSIDRLWKRWESVNGDHTTFIDNVLASAYRSLTVRNLFTHLLGEVLERRNLKAVLIWILVGLLSALLALTDEYAQDLLKGMFSGALGQLAAFFLLFFFTEGYNRWCQYYELMVISEGRLVAVVEFAKASIDALGEVSLGRCEAKGSQQQEADEPTSTENPCQRLGDFSAASSNADGVSLSGDEFVQEIWRLVSLSHLFYIGAMGSRGISFARQACAEFETVLDNDQLYGIPSGFRMLTRVARIESLYPKY